MRQSRFIILMLIYLLAMNISYAQEQSDLVLILDGDVITANVADSADITAILADGEAFDPIYTMSDITTNVNPIVSPDGNRVYFHELFNNQLWTMELNNTGESTTLTDMAIAVPFNATFSSDGTHILIPVQAEGNTPGLVELWSASLDGANLEQIGVVAIDVGCGGGAEIPDLAAYNYQAGFMGNALLLAWPQNDVIIASTSCTGVGVQILILSTGQVSSLDSQLSRAKLSPDNTTVAGIVDNTLRLIDLTTGEVQDYLHGDGGQIDQVSWSPDGRLVFTTISERAEIVLQPQDEQLAMDVLYGLEPTTIPLYSTTLYLFDPITESIQELWSMNGWRGVPVMSVTSDAVYFSAIPDMEAMVTALNEGKDFIQVVEARPTSSVYMSSLVGDTKPMLLFEGGEFPIALP